MYSILMSGQPVAVSADTFALFRSECSVRAGFPSPAEDFAVQRLELGDLLIEHPQASFLLRVSGPSMREEGIDDGDLVVVLSVIDNLVKGASGQAVQNMNILFGLDEKLGLSHAGMLP